MIPYPPPTSYQRIYFPNRKLLDKLLNILVVGVSKGLNNPRCEFGLKLNTRDIGFTTEFYQKPVQNSVSLYNILIRNICLNLILFMPLKKIKTNFSNNVLHCTYIDTILLLVFNEVITYNVCKFSDTKFFGPTIVKKISNQKK